MTREEYTKYQRNRRKLHPGRAAAYQKKYRERYPDRIKASAQAAYERARAEINSLKSKPCTDCGIQYPPYVMDFDHRDGRTKRFNIAECTRRNLVAEEALKCDVVCSNCHRERTHQRHLKNKS